MRWTRITAFPVTAAFALAAAGCGNSTNPAGTAGNATGSTTAPTTAPTTTSPASTVAPVSMPSPVGTFGTKPTVTVPTGPPPTVLESSDLITGTGATAEKGQTITVQYVLVSYATGKQLDASWDRNMPFSFGLGQGQVIPGWDEGVVGMKVGGRRELILPPNLAYGASPPPNSGIPVNATLIFVVDLLKIG